MTRIKKHSGRKLKEIREEKETIYIFCKGEKTEPLYLKGLINELHSPNIEIKVKGTGYNTQSLIDYADQNSQEKSEDDDVWIVLDKDDFPNFEKSIKNAQSKGFNIAYSNECFELWYLLHFSKFNTPCGRKMYYTKLLPELKKLDSKIRIESYRNKGKAIKNIYELLKPFQETAIENSKWLEIQNKHINPISQKPSTTVHHLVETLLSL